MEGPKTIAYITEVMDACRRGEEIEYRELDSMDDWELWSVFSGGPFWNWEEYEYRIKPKRKFKEGDKLIRKDAEALSISGERDDNMATVRGYTSDGLVEFLGATAMFETQVIENYIKVNEALWYWECKMSDGWQISKTRLTKDQAQRATGGVIEIAPLYALGFRLSKNQ